jgi:hypothetical protein
VRQGNRDFKKTTYFASPFQRFPFKRPRPIEKTKLVFSLDRGGADEVK